MISIHALLAESDLQSVVHDPRQLRISIHALLAESDWSTCPVLVCLWRFQSTLSLRRATFLLPCTHSNPEYFNPRSPCGERHGEGCRYMPWRDFNPRSPCGERPDMWTSRFARSVISIHALLAESDWHSQLGILVYTDFNPRSPCGERQQIPPNWPYRFCLKCQFKDGEKSKKAKGSASAQASSPAYEKNKVRIPWGDFECFRFAPIK